MNIEFVEGEEHLTTLLELYESLDPEEALFMNHYQLAEATGQSASKWKEFITHPKVSSFIDSELVLFQQHQLRQMIRDASDDKRAVGAAQMINALAKLDTSKDKVGPYIIYTHVPLTEQQQGSETPYQQETSDIIEALSNWEDEQPV